ncbi:MAG: aminopeptidase P N-terminal domain-containing protein [Zoogloeaceae bacterium]|jgi:Xaa-Pro aminopeptidase|nr:aminopeptidase P N-terminal domain-containing protein [Zoogloeaceae bacterium]
MTFDFSPFARRRAHLLNRIGDGVALIPTAPERLRNRDNPYPYRADSYFWHLTGFPEPEAALVLAGGRSILFCREKDALREIWNGFRYGPAAAALNFGFDEAWPIASLDEKLPQFIADHPTLWHAFGLDAEWDARVTRALNAVRAQARSGKRPPGSFCDWRAPLDALRLVKDATEQTLMRRAADITSAGHARAMRACAAGAQTEYALEAELGHEFRRQGASGHAYTPIVAGGKNACVLHYADNDQPLADGALVLIDAGCELESYAADITRTFPVNGRFSPAQKDCYEIVLAAQAAAISATRPGIRFNVPHEAAVRVLTQGMVDLGLMTGEVDGLIESGACRRFYMHNTGHWLGLDVHDVGDYKEAGKPQERWRELVPGMTLTCEPGLYIPAAPDVPAALHNIGIRIEDDLLVTPDGCEVYTHAPKSVREIEDIMRHD